LNYEEARRLARSWCEAWSKGDLDAVMRHYADDVKFSSPTVIKRLGIVNGWIEGKARLREHFAVGIRAPGYASNLWMFYWGSAGCVLFISVKPALSLLTLSNLMPTEKEKWCKLFTGSLDNRLSQTKTGLICSSHAISLIRAMVY